MRARRPHPVNTIDPRRGTRTILAHEGQNERREIASAAEAEHTTQSTMACCSCWLRPGARRSARLVHDAKFIHAFRFRATISPVSTHLSATLDVVSTGSSVGKAASVYLVNTGTRERNALG